MHKLDTDFHRFFPEYDFELRDIQKETITRVLENKNTLCIIPTGGGKSIINWMAALELGGITIVVSPLIALISEQSEKLSSFGYKVLELHAGIDSKKQIDIMKKFARGDYTPDFIFVSPEKMATDGFFEYCLQYRKNDIKLVVIDEVHCVSQWGISFRPFYKRIPAFLDVVFGINSWCNILALTATLNPRELSDIGREFKISRENIIKSDLLLRKEIQLHVQKFTNEDEKEEKFWEILKTHRGEKTLVYVYRKYKKRGVEDFQREAAERGYNAVYFHGDMRPDERNEIVRQYREGKIDVVFATNAFGMGIDIKDIRVVIHFMIPESAEQYYQEIGRAARDGCAANAYLLYSNKNIEVKKSHFIDRSMPDENKLKEVYAKIGNKTGYKIINYFEDEEIQQCLPYYIEAGIVSIVGKGFPDLTVLSEIKSPVLQEYFDSTKTKGYCLTIKKCNISSKELSDTVYKEVLNERVKLSKALPKWIVLEILQCEIDEEAMDKMLKSIEEKKTYKYELLDYFVYLINNNANTQHLHQEIARYLGMDKHQLARIYETEDGNVVRSKSEVIICNLLYNNDIEYEYEKKLYYGSEGKWIEPDFTVKIEDKVFYWEHVGMLGTEKYDDDWLKKLDIYEKYFAGQLIKTYESGVLSKDAKEIIKGLK